MPQKILNFRKIRINQLKLTLNSELTSNNHVQSNKAELTQFLCLFLFQNKYQVFYSKDNSQKDYNQTGNFTLQVKKQLSIKLFKKKKQPQANMALIYKILLYNCINNKIFTMDQSQSFPFLNYVNYLNPPFTIPNHIMIPDAGRLDALLAENTRVLEENRCLQEQVAALTKENKRLRNENLQLRREQETQFRVEKRKYTPRRKQLSKDFLCEVEGCRKSYSSTIALRNHQRGVHEMSKRNKNRHQ